MKIQDAVRESVQDFFQHFAYLDLNILPGDEAPAAGWTRCACVMCDEGADEAVVLFRPEFVKIIAEGFSGSPDCDESKMLDLVLEAANILAGQAYEIAHGGQKPKSIGQPAWLSPEEAGLAWARALPEHRHALHLEGVLQGGMVFTSKEAWSSKWE
jgi:hypothetical protein